eukprot:scaffold59947_cov59-Phaeocystis_antarctica.AAC.5
MSCSSFGSGTSYLCDVAGVELHLDDALAKPGIVSGGGSGSGGGGIERRKAASAEASKENSTGGSGSGGSGSSSWAPPLGLLETLE